MPILDVPGLGQFDLPDNSTPEQVNQFVSDLNEVKTATAPATTGDYLARQAGLTARAAINPVTTGALAGAAIGAPLAGVGAVPGALAGATAGAIVDFTPRIYNKIAEMVGAEGRLPALGDVLEQIKNEAGLPNPVTSAEKLSQAAVEGATSMVPTLGAGQLLQKASTPVLRGIGNILTERPALQSLQAVGGAMASEGARQSGAGAVGQMAAGMAGVAVPSLATLGEGGVKSLLRGGAKAEDIASNIRAFEEAGLTPSAGQATQATPIKAVEASMAKVPGSYDVLRDFGTKQQKGLQEKLAGITEELSPVTEPTVAGTGIKEGVPKAFAKKRIVESRLYNNLETLLPPKTQSSVDNFKKTLKDVMEPIPGAPALSAGMENKMLTQIKSDFESDIKKTGTLSVEALRVLRSKIGNALAGISLLNDVPRREFKLLYGGLSDDIKELASKQGNKALNLFNRASSYSKALHDRADKLQSFINKQEPELIYKAAFEGSKSGGTRLGALMKSLQPEEQKAITTTFVDNMGRALPGQQNELGDVWSSNTFLTNFNKLSNPAKQQLFGRYGSEFRIDLEKIAKASALIRGGGNVLANPSGTAAGLAPIALATTFFGSLGAGKYGVAQGVGGLLASSYAGSKLFTNPKYVRWLAKNIEVTPNQIPAAVASLQTLANNEDDPELDAMAKLLKQQAIQNSLGK
jgi:hypothetical protein